MDHRTHARQCSPLEAAILANALGDTPETIFACQRLSRGLCPAYLTGEPARYVGAIVEALPGRLFAFGEDPLAMWRLLQSLRGWTSIVVAPQHAGDLGALIERETGRAVQYQEELVFTLPAPVVAIAHPAVRLMTPSEVDVVVNGPGGSIGAAYGSAQALLAEGYAAGAVIDGALVARAHTSCQSPRFSDVAVATAEQWRGKGLASAAASLVCEHVQRSGRVPVWSTTHDNLASQRIARKLGFVFHATVIAIIPAALPLPL